MSRGYDNNLHVGLVLMIALASKNAILIVEFARDLHREGLSITEAAVEATSCGVADRLQSQLPRKPARRSPTFTYGQRRMISQIKPVR
jgi:AcrB/AcrD/AcrF family